MNKRIRMRLLILATLLSLRAVTSRISFSGDLSSIISPSIGASASLSEDKEHPSDERHDRHEQNQSDETDTHNLDHDRDNHEKNDHDRHLVVNSYDHMDTDSQGYNMKSDQKRRATVQSDKDLHKRRSEHDLKPPNGVRGDDVRHVNTGRGALNIEHLKTAEESFTDDNHYDHHYFEHGKDDDDRHLQMVGICDHQDSSYKMQCETSCNVIDGKIYPTFSQFEKACQSQPDYFNDCAEFYDCLMGCEVHSENVEIRVLKSNPPLLADALRLEKIPVEDQCDAMKCRSYCVRQRFDTCREIQFKESCDAKKRSAFGGLARCDVDCSSAYGRMAFTISWIGSLMIFSWIIS